MTNQTIDVKNLTDIELMRFLLLNETNFQQVQANIQELRTEMARRVNEETKETKEPKNDTPNDTSLPVDAN